MVKKRVRKKKNKKAVSVLIGYVLLVVFAIILSVGVYTWLRSYVPAQTLTCKDGISLTIKSSTFNATGSNKLNVTLKNNGRFNVAGYFLYATNSSNQNLATIDLSQYFDKGNSGRVVGNSIMFYADASDSFAPGQQVSNIFDIPSQLGTLDYLQVVPALYQNDSNNRIRFTSCSQDSILQKVGEGAYCKPNCNNRVCGSDGCGGTCAPGCNATAPTCDNIQGRCYNPSTCKPASNPKNPCGSQTCGTVLNGTNTATACGSVVCGTCAVGSYCNTTAATPTCVSLCGNGINNTGEQCDDGNTNNGDGCSSTCTIETGWICQTGPNGVSQCARLSGSYNSCGDYCSTFPGYTPAYTCQQNPQQCGKYGEVYVGNVTNANATIGNSFCTFGNANSCCCTPA